MNYYTTYLSLKRCSYFKSCYVIIVLFFIFAIPKNAFTQENNFDEISITLHVQQIGSAEIPAVIIGNDAYLPVKEIFDFLKIKNSPSNYLDSLSGFLINPKATYLIDKINNRIILQDKIFDMKPADLIHTATSLYLRSDFFGSIFGLDCIFNFRSLSVNLHTKLELPAIREMRQEEMHRNIIKLKGDRKADTTIKQKFAMFHLGTADWSVINTNETISGSNTRVNMNLGAIVAGGETDVYLSYNSQQQFNLKQQFYRWRYVNNDNSVLRQVSLGNIYTQATSSIYGAITGLQLTNAPTTYRRSFGTYRLSNTTEPGWMVELYVNNVLVNYTKADASGFFTFEVPLVYGSSLVKLHFYSPWGEERTREENINIPFNFLPLNQFEYNVSAGIVDDEQKSKFSRINLNYGLGNRITIGGGMEYLSSVTSGNVMPFLTASLRLGSRLLLSGEHTYGVRSKGIINFRLPSNSQLEINYTKYEKGQTAIRSGKSLINNYLEERKAVLSVPFRGTKFSLFSRLSFNQLKLSNMVYSTGEFLLSGIVGGVVSNLTTSAVYSNPSHPLIYSNLSAGIRFKKGIRITPQAQYEHTQKNFSRLKCEVEKSIFNRGFINFSYEKNMATKSNYVGVALRYNFSFAQTSFSVTKTGDATSMVQSARGSLMYNDEFNNIKLNNQSNVGRGGLTIMPFLDINGNGKRDFNEPKVPGLKVRIDGGRIEHDKHDTVISVFGLEAYTTYHLEFDRNNFENISWQIRKRTINVITEPNHFKLIEVPIAVEGEVSGTVFLNDNKGNNGIGRIIVNIYNSDSVIVAKMLTEPDGFFNYIGLSPGNYSVRLDNEQLNKLHMVASPSTLVFTIKENKDGDVVDGLKFVISPP